VNLRELDEQVGSVDTEAGAELIYGLLEAYGLPRASITRLKNGSYDQAAGENEVLWKGKVYCRFADQPDDDLHLLIDKASEDERILKHRPRFLIVHDGADLVAIDRVTDDSLDISLGTLGDHASFFYPWAGVEKSRRDNVSQADIKATEKMAKLYDEIVKLNEISSAEDRHNLNVFFARLLFCFFAEDSEVFEAGQFTNAIGSLTQEDGKDAHLLLDEIFAALNRPEDERELVRPELKSLGYVGGSLFEQEAPSPKIGRKARDLLIDCGTLDWAQINPDIFGSMVQVVVHPEQRSGLGMHYTSPENILKVLRPLFLDDLEEEFLKAEDDQKKLKRLLDRISKIKVFDPACGSGNFLIIAYKRLRELENRIIERLGELDPSNVGLFKLSGVSLDNFYGIEISDFAAEIAKLSLWLAKHQANLEFKEHFGVEISLIPIQEEGHITCANATRLDWSNTCPPSEEVYLAGNPPYVGSSMQDEGQKADFVAYFGTDKYPKNLDYISLWFFLGAEYAAAHDAVVGFVSTNSVCQGDHVALMWPRLLDTGVEIAFAHQSFRWSNEARGNAGVTCVVIGLSPNPPRERALASEGLIRRVKHINPYLVESRRDAIVGRRGEAISDLPPMLMGSKPTDGGHLILSPEERRDLLAESPDASCFVRRYMGAEDFVQGKERYCLWIEDLEAEKAAAIPVIRQRLELVTASRLAGSTTAQGMADRPHRFLQRPHKDAPAIIVPGTTSERREYVPVGFLETGTVVSNSAYVVYEAPLWLFPLIQSRSHNVWLRAVAGRLKTDMRYSAVIVYNNFPVPELSNDQKAELETHALGVLGAREDFPERTLAELYDPDKMPGSLRAAHLALDEAVDALYSNSGFASDEDRLSALFDLYEVMTTEEGELTLA
jgi:hypothetical protein